MMEKKEIMKEQNAIRFLPKDSVLFSSAVIFSRLIDFNDTDDTASLSKATAMNVRLFENLSWDNFNLTIDHKKHQGRFVSPSLGNLSLMVQSFEDEGRGSLLPRLRHTSNSSYFEFALKNISTVFKQSRFAVEVILVGGDKQQNGTSFSISRSIADQYTPSVFYVDNINFANSNSSQGGYMSWKPVAYTEEERHLANGRMVHQYGLNTTSVGYVPSYSIAHAFYGNLSQLNLSSMNVSFGNDGDGYYAASNYLVWGGLIGYGEAPLDGLSMLISLSSLPASGFQLFDSRWWIRHMS
ncbi:putative glycosylated lysosomal membrane protein A [Apostichopus japonicus]|uniref:Putative glycosylated lysosomal membrane protein A n=1 Tax=Stichopus japonicus TaxID=307972 RepID=A0A2G8LKL3_STIJA|nr:putative glycosylated lysosomal membrane protein A [Apostichopus japonicus]